MLSLMQPLPTPHRLALKPASAAPYIWLAALMSLALFGIDTWWPQFGWLARPLIWLGTLFHELGHGIAAIMVGGELVQLAIYPDGSGLATYQGVSSTMDRALVAAAGPLGAPIAGLLLFFSLGHRHAARLALAMLGAGLAVAVLLWVRNAFALGFIAALALWLTGVAWRGSERAVYLLSAFIAVEMSLSAFTRMDYLFTAGAATGAGTLPSDTAQIAQALGFSHIFWGAMLGLVALGVVAVGAWRAMRLGRLQP
ncbi:M50 family metallopeptidase [Aquimonas voraii]|uniref:Peptidase M50B-like n=1 Tax=Aquimonas voraii TaxID=265719 RepID=A0A1G6SZW9_9GAMM|nr:M50 family metallopeptidase [Aquimonas voraii]SDD21655.1 Peptidase M50B-like [Aquimonas voraii]